MLSDSYDLANPQLDPELEIRYDPSSRCPGCGLVMSNREAIEQGACNDCYGGAYEYERP
jgi:hypothetical protein